MLSNSSLRYFSQINKLRYYLNKINLNEKKYFKLILNGIIPRPQYAFCLFMSANLAAQLGYKKISAIEFGCWEGEGLLDLEHYSSEIEKIFQIDIEIYGFDGGKGLPEPQNFKDRLYQFSTGEMKLSKNSCIDKLKKSKLIIGILKTLFQNLFKKTNMLP